MAYRTEIIKHNEISADKWNELAESAQASSAFSLYQYNSLFEGDRIFYIVISDSLSGKWYGGIAGRLKGRLPLAGNLFATVVAETSALIRTNMEHESRHLKKLLYSELISCAKKYGAMQVFLNHWSREEDKESLASLGFNTVVNPTFEIDTTTIYPAIFEKYSDTCRNKIRKARKNNVTVKIFSGNISEDQIKIIETLSKSTFKRAHRKSNETTMQLKSEAFYRTLFNNMPGNSRLAIAYNESGFSVSFAILLTGAERSIYYRGGSDLEGNRLTGSSNFLIDRLIAYTIDEGIPCFDFGGVPFSPSPTESAWGLFKFKESFGGNHKLYYSGNYLLSKFRHAIFLLLLNNRFIIRLYTLIKPVN